MHRVTVGVVMVVATLAVAALAVASAAGQAAGPWVDALLATGVVVLVATAGFVVVELVTGAVLRLVTFVLAPEQPPGLVRLARMIEEYESETTEHAGHPSGHVPGAAGAGSDLPGPGGWTGAHP